MLFFCPLFLSLSYSFRLRDCCSVNTSTHCSKSSLRIMKFPLHSPPSLHCGNTQQQQQQQQLNDTMCQTAKWLYTNTLPGLLRITPPLCMLSLHSSKTLVYMNGRPRFFINSWQNVWKASNGFPVICQSWCCQCFPLKSLFLQMLCSPYPSFPSCTLSLTHNGS